MKNNNTLVWVFLAGSFIWGFFPSKLNDVTMIISFVMAIALLVVIEIDYRKVMKWYMENTGEKKKPFGDIWILIFPAYLWKRNKLIGEKQTTFYVSIAFIVADYIIGAIIAALLVASA